MKYAQLVIGPAGCGKSTYCHNLQEHCNTIGRSVHVINLGARPGRPRRPLAVEAPLTARPPADPAAEHFQYQVSVDVRDLITLEDVMDELELGPNGCAHPERLTEGRPPALPSSARLRAIPAAAWLRSPAAIGG